MKSEKLISVIIPVYNADKYLRGCLDSIQKQENCNYEVILIDDGSVDSSGKICDEYAQQDIRFKVIHKQNEGVSVARNVGLEVSKGAWVAFVDADDECSPSYLNIPSKVEQSDVIIKEARYIFMDGHEIVCKSNNKTIVKWEEIGHIWLTKRNNALWDKLISRQVIGNTRFIPGVTVSEDFLFFTSILHKVKSYSYSTEGCYLHYVREVSAMTKFMADPRENIKITFEHLFIVKNMACINKMQPVCEGLIYGYFMQTLWRNRNILTREEWNRFLCIHKEMKITKLHLVGIKAIAKILLTSLMIKLRWNIPKFQS